MTDSTPAVTFGICVKMISALLATLVLSQRGQAESSKVIGYARSLEGSQAFLDAGVSDRGDRPYPRLGPEERWTAIRDLQQLDELGRRSHAAGDLCGSIDFFPLTYSTVDSVEHRPPYFGAEAEFPALDAVLGEVQLAKIDETIATLSLLPSRFHRHSTGQNASVALKGLWQSEILEPAAWTVSERTHTSTPQRSVIARLDGDNAETVILGAHLDSIGSRSDPEAIAPGSDDDASGLAILTEILRIIESRHLRFHRRIELHAYAAEEIGLVGSREIASDYRKSAAGVAGMMQFDMGYYSKPGDEGRLYFLENFTSLDLTRSGVQWTKRYLGDVYRRGFLPLGASSDHKAWREQGYPTLFAFENPEADNPFIHSAEDTSRNFDDGLRMQRMAKLGLLFLSYQAGLVALDGTYLEEKNRLNSRIIPKDLYIATQDDSAGAYSFAVSAPESTSFLEYCPIEEADDLRCTGERLRLTANQVRGDRRIFALESGRKFAPDEKWRIEAYSAKDALIARRAIQWQKPR